MNSPPRRWPALALALCLPLSAASTAGAEEPAPPAGIPACPSAEDQPNVDELIKRTEQLLEGSSSVATMRMDITSPRWKRSLTFKVWARGEDRALIRIVKGSPREVGMLTLKRDKQLWNYLPKAGRVMKLPSGMLGDSWMGSDFTNDDLVQGSSISDDFVTEFKGTIEHQGRKAWHIVLTPKPDAVVVWGRIEMVVDRATCNPLVQRNYDEEGELARRMEFGEFKQIGWRTFPTRMVLIPEEEGRKTIITYEEVEFDVEIDDDTFSMKRLRRGR